MTVIVRTLVEEGFVVAADGRKTGARDGSVKSDSVQKIFPIKSPGAAFAYSITGTINLRTDNNELAVSLAHEIEQSAESLTNRKTKNLTGYAIRLCRPVCRALEDARASGRLSRYPSHQQSVPGESGDTIMRICIDGFRDGHPSSVTVRLFHQNNRLCEPEVLVELNRFGFPKVLGRPEILRLLWFTQDERFSRYRRLPAVRAKMTLREAIDESRCYIEACSTPEALAVDPECHAVGGHIHIATITASDGFRWVVAPISE